MNAEEKEKFSWQLAGLIAADQSKSSWGYDLSERLAVKKADDLIRALEDLTPEDTKVDCENGKHFPSKHSEHIRCIFCGAAPKEPEKPVECEHRWAIALGNEYCKECGETR